MGFSENFIILGIQIVALFFAIWYGLMLRNEAYVGVKPRGFSQLAFAFFLTVTIALFFYGA